MRELRITTCYEREKMQFYILNYSTDIRSGRIRKITKFSARMIRASVDIRSLRTLPDHAQMRGPLWGGYDHLGHQEHNGVLRDMGKEEGFVGGK
jgi:hypothetical protein